MNTLIPHTSRLIPLLSLLFALFLFACAPALSGPVQTATPPSALTPAPRLTSTPDAPPTPTIVVPTLPSVDPAELRGLNIEFWHFFPPEQIAPLLRAFNTTNPWGITAAPRYFGSAADLSSALAEAHTAKTLPAVVVGYSDQLRHWYLSGYITDLSPFFQDSQWGLVESDRADYLAPFLAQTAAGSSQLGLPARGSAVFLAYNQTWAGELGYSLLPSTPERLQAQLCAANLEKKSDPDVRNDFQGGWIANSDPAAMLGWLSAFGAAIAAPDADGYDFSTSSTASAFTYLKSLADANCAWVSSESYSEEPFSRREALAVTAGLVDLPFFVQAFTDTSNSDRWSVMAFPAESGSGVLPVFGPSFAVTQGTPVQHLAGWLFARWLTTPEAQAFWTRLDGYFPVRSSAADLLADYRSANPHWSQAWSLLPAAVTEPPLASWGAVQWALQDAGTQIFRSYFTVDRIEATLEELDKTAAELHRRQENNE